MVGQRLTEKVQVVLARRVREPRRQPPTGPVGREHVELPLPLPQERVEPDGRHCAPPPRQLLLRVEPREERVKNGARGRVAPKEAVEAPAKEQAGPLEEKGVR